MKKDNKQSSDREDKRSSDRYADREGKKSFGRDDRRSSNRFDDRDNKRSFDKFGDRDNKRSFGRDDKRSFDKFGDRDNKRSFGRDDKRSFDKSGDRDNKRSFGRDDKRSFDKFGDRDNKRPFGRDDKRSFDKSGDRGRDDNDFKYGGRRKFTPAKSPASESWEDDGLIRLNRYIANSGICSRRKADELIEAGVISVNGEVITELGTKVDPAKDEIRYNNERLKREKMVYVLLNKPKDYITTTDDPQERNTVMQLVSKATKERIYPVGRLDRNTTGLLLLTNDGNLAEKLSHPRNNISKLYHVELDKNLTQGDFNKIEFGLTLEDGVIKPDDLSFIQGGSKREVGIQIHSGKNRIVRRIFESLGYEIVKLDRVVYANLTKKDLPRGRWRYLEERELIQLKHFVK
jgi:23S rRNA pseudouridine2605 synthase